jgi:hypothetical protein
MVKLNPENSDIPFMLFRQVIEGILNVFDITDVTISSADPDLEFHNGDDTYTGLSAIIAGLSDIPEKPKDTNNSFPLRILITSIGNNVKGTVIYGNIPSTGFGLTKYRSSRSVEINAKIGELDPDNNGKQIISITGINSLSNVDKLKVGDVLYTFGDGVFIPTIKIRLLMSVVVGFSETPITGTSIFLQIGDGSEYPNNPVFEATITSIVNRYDSNTLQLDPLPPPTNVPINIPLSNITEYPLFLPSEQTGIPDQILNGFDYVLDIDLSTKTIEDRIFAAPLEQYSELPILGLVTIYSGRQNPATPSKGICPYGRGIVMNTDST